MPKKPIPEAAEVAVEFDTLDDDQKEQVAAVIRKLKEAPPEVLTTQEVSDTFDGLSDEGKRDVSRYLYRTSQREARIAARNE